MDWNWLDSLSLLLPVLLWLELWLEETTVEGFSENSSSLDFIFSYEVWLLLELLSNGCRH
jgi:hypothetical protein